MNTSGLISERLLVPRWRTFARTIAARELASHRGRSDPLTISHIEKKRAQWSDRPNLTTSAELVEVAIAECRETEAVDAARQLLRNYPTAMPMVRNQAVSVLRRAGFSEEVASFDDPIGPADAREWRASLRIYPQDAIGWTELAWHQVVAGTPAAASRSISIALALAPFNRHVLRSAARFYLHRDDPERAHDIIVRNAASRLDPWLLSAEISLARAAQRNPKFIKLGENVLKASDFAPLDLSELAGAVGTAFLFDGRKGLRKLFLQSLEDPTANALAQGEWASRRIGGNELVSDDNIARVPEAFEALAFHRYGQSRFAEVPDICEEWAKVDSFSVRPFEFGAAAASHALDFKRAADLAEAGLRRRPTGAVLLNALAFALGSQGDVEGALRALGRLLPDRLDERLRNIRAANVGLCAFRAGRVDEGLSAYRLAIEGFARINAKSESASARVYLAREAELADHPDAKKLLDEAEAALRPFKDAEVWLVVKRLRGENVDGQVADAIAARERAQRLARLRAVTWTTPGLPGQEQVVHRLRL